MFGMGFDGCSTNTGNKSGVGSRLKQFSPGTITVECRAHKTHLILVHSLPEIPSDIFGLMTKVPALFKSSNKLHNYDEMKADNINLVGLYSHKIKKLHDQRWLAAELCTENYIENWDILLLFCKSLSQKGDTAATEIVTIMESKDTKLYFLLVHHVTRELNRLNLLLQTKKVILPILQDEIEKTFKNIASFVLKRNYVNNVPANDIDFCDTNNYLRFLDFNLGEEVREELLSRGDDLEDFCKRAFNFVVCACLEMKIRFKFDDPLFNVAKCLLAKNALSDKFRQLQPKLFDKLLKLFSKFTRGKEEVLKKEWDALPNLLKEWEKLPAKEAPFYLLNFDTPIEKFWFYLCKLGSDNIKPYYNLAHLALGILTIPHANADCERSFSSLNYLKNIYRNRMDKDTGDACLRGRENAIDNAVNGVFEPSDRMIKIAMEKKFYKKK